MRAALSCVGFVLALALLALSAVGAPHDWLRIGPEE